MARVNHELQSETSSNSYQPPSAHHTSAIERDHSAAGGPQLGNNEDDSGFSEDCGYGSTRCFSGLASSVFFAETQAS